MNRSTCTLGVSASPLVSPSLAAIFSIRAVLKVCFPRVKPLLHGTASRIGDKVEIWGAWVFDSQHGFYEFHPVFSVSFSTDGGETWGETYTSGPQYGGSPQTVPSASTTYRTCRDENGSQCMGYYDPTQWRNEALGAPRKEEEKGEGALRASYSAALFSGRSRSSTPSDTLGWLPWWRCRTYSCRSPLSWSCPYPAS
jgi:hypothetical protein